MKPTLFLALPAFVAGALLLAGCGGGGSTFGSARTLTGTSVAMGTGHARSFVRVGSNGRAEAVGVLFDEASLNSLMASVSAAPAQPGDEQSFALPLPANAPGTLVDHVALDWNPHGHPPQGIYSNAHFDVHFYTMTAQQQAQIAPTPAVLAGADTPAPEARFVALGYVSGHDGVPFQGVHYSDVSGAEFNPPHLSDHTFIYGFYQGKQTFFEPMVSADFLQAKTDFSAPVKQPAAYQTSGLFPSNYSVHFDAASKQYSITLAMTPR